MIEPASVGEQFTTTLGPEHDSHTFTVCESCGTNNGQWYCITCDKVFRHNLDKDGHIGGGGDHRLAWICFEHGPETP